MEQQLTTVVSVKIAEKEDSPASCSLRSPVAFAISSCQVRQKSKVLIRDF